MRNNSSNANHPWRSGNQYRDERTSDSLTTNAELQSIIPFVPALEPRMFQYHYDQEG